MKHLNAFFIEPIQENMDLGQCLHCDFHARRRAAEPQTTRSKAAVDQEHGPAKQVFAQLLLFGVPLKMWDIMSFLENL